MLLFGHRLPAFSPSQIKRLAALPMDTIWDVLLDLFAISQTPDTIAATAAMIAGTHGKLPCARFLRQLCEEYSLSVVIGLRSDVRFLKDF
jgi:hypothetical protein